MKHEKFPSKTVDVNRSFFSPIAALVALAALGGCSGSNSDTIDLPGMGGSMNVGGNRNTSVGGSGTGSVAASGGTTATSSGGTSSPATGGTTEASTGGKSGAVGGAGGGALPPSSGGNVTTTGGRSGAGGGALAQGGSVGKGGGSAVGGVTAAGGISAKGGSTSAGGTVAIGGAATGGVVAAAGATAANSEDDGADCTIGTLPEASALTANAKLPDPFKKLDGTRMATKAEWRCRRQEIKRLAEKFAYGTKTIPKAGTVTGTVSSTSITVKVADNGKTATFSATVSLPSGTGPFPAVVILGGLGADTATIKAAGAATIAYDPYSVGAEGTSRSAKSGAYYTINGSTSTTGLLAAWGWGVSRIIDVIAQSDGKILKADAIGVTGCSRFGKGAFIVGVFDQRIALTMPIESGSAGVPIWRGIPGEGAQSLPSAYGEQPWFGDAFSAFTGSPTKAPIDTHEVVAMVAPRGLFIMDNPHIANLGPKSASVAALGGAEVYKALGAGDNITYWSDVQDGSHCAIRPEWKDPLTKNIQKFLVKTGTFTGVMKISSKAAGKLSDWSDWTTPTLN